MKGGQSCGNCAPTDVRVSEADEADEVNEADATVTGLESSSSRSPSKTLRYFGVWATKKKRSSKSTAARGQKSSVAQTPPSAPGAAQKMKPAETLYKRRISHATHATQSNVAE